MSDGVRGGVLRGLSSVPACLAIAGTAGLVLVASACSQAPPPVVRPAAAAPASPAASPASPATATAPATPVAPHNSESETKTSVLPATPPLVKAASVPTPGVVATPPAVPVPAAVAPTPTVPATVPPVITPAAAVSVPVAVPPPTPPAATPASSPSSLVVPIDPWSSKKVDPSVLVVVDPADADADSRLSLVDAAKAEKERKAQAPPPRISINDKNLHTYAKGGQLTVADPKKKSGTAGQATAAATTGAAVPAAAGGAAVPIERNEKYWRGRALEIRQRWRKASDRIKVLEGDVNLWRRRFYAEDDPYVRDGQIKPAWDRALDELREDHVTVDTAKKELADFLEEGRQAGALPGWLREGSDLEPKEEKPVDPLQPTETPILKDNG
jgi:hypothetical protein